MYTHFEPEATAFFIFYFYFYYDEILSTHTQT